MKINGLKVSFETMLLVNILDDLNWIVWSKSEDGAKNRNRPKSIYNSLIGKEEKTNDEIQTFDSVEEFEMARNKIIKGGTQ